MRCLAMASEANGYVWRMFFRMRTVLRQQRRKTLRVRDQRRQVLHQRRALVRRLYGLRRVRRFQGGCGDLAHAT